MNVETMSVLGAGAFGTALAMSIAQTGQSVFLWGRDVDAMAQMQISRENVRHLAGLQFPDALTVTSDVTQAGEGHVLLLAVPTQSLRALLTEHRDTLQGRILIACCKGVERGTGLLPTQVIQSILPNARVGMLTGPSFAADIAVAKPTALTLAIKDPADEQLQNLLSTPALRLYLSDDLVGAQLGGALKNVVAIAAGIVMGAGLGDSARSALMTRAFAEMTSYAQSRGARAETLFGLSGLGDLILTCTSVQSRNFRHGFAFGSGAPLERAVTVEGVMTAHALIQTYESDARAAFDSLPVTYMVSALLQDEITLDEAIRALLGRSLKREMTPASE